jgi:hypothetical protein
MKKISNKTYIVFIEAYYLKILSFLGIFDPPSAILCEEFSSPQSSPVVGNECSCSGKAEKLRGSRI